ncbi:7843_t:CDS:2, partial [Diversispora eburnea]
MENLKTKLKKSSSQLAQELYLELDSMSISNLTWQDPIAKVPDKIRRKCVEFTENFNSEDVNILPQKLTYNGTWKESNEDLVETTIEILNV